MRTMFRDWMAIKPSTMASSFSRQEAGKASTPAINTMDASTPLHPASIDTAKPLTESRNMRPVLMTVSSNGRMIDAETHASPAVKGWIRLACTGLSNSSVNNTSRQAKKMNRNLDMGIPTESQC